MAQTIGTRYGALWEKMVKEVLSHSNIVTVGEKILYKDFVKKWTKDYVSKLDDKCCKENCTEILKSFLNVNTGTDRQDLCDLILKGNGVLQGIDTKYRFTSNDSSKVREIANSAKYLKYLGYEPILFFRTSREKNRESAINRFENNGWKLVFGKEASDFLFSQTGFNLDEWIIENVNIWSEISEYHEYLNKIEFEKNIGSFNLF